MEMLLESTDTITLNYEHNNDYSLRALLGEVNFKDLILTAVDIVRETDSVQSVCLLDKIFERRKVLQTLIEIQFSRIQRTKPLRFISATKEVQQVNTNHLLQ